MASFVDEPPPPALQRAADESDLDPAAFLKSVRELSEKREREDAERYRKLEEEIEKGKQDRAARRAERARSISPEKSNTTASRPLRSPANASSTRTPPPMTSPASTSATMDSSNSQASAPGNHEIPEFRGFGSLNKPTTSTPTSRSPALRSEPSDSTSLPSRSASSLARSGTLSWQQRRPKSRDGSSRPLSAVSTDSSAQSQSAASQAEPSRDQIAASLGSRDPSWFRQTADRGIGNAAYRKNKDESSTSDSVVYGRRGLPGMSRETSNESRYQSNPAPIESTKIENASRSGSVQGSVVSSNFSTTRTSTGSKPDLKSLIAEDEGQDKASPMSDRTSSSADREQPSVGRTQTMSSSQARIANAPERPESPTKGTGGFVQSAMMKRSESVTKRWSAQPGASASISRNNSLASVRSGYGGLTGSHSMPRLEPTASGREPSDQHASRPTSSSSNLTNLMHSQARDDGDVFAKPALPSSSRPKSVVSNYSATAEDGHTSPPASPSKRWSPTKSSWLESAISKPDSPKPAPSRNSQPSWMADIAKVKAQKGSADEMAKTVETETSKPESPMKPSFGQSMLKRSESGGLDPSQSQTPSLAERPGSRPTSPIKAPSGQSSLTRSESRDLKPPPEPSSANVSRTINAVEQNTTSTEPLDAPTAMKASEQGAQSETHSEPGRITTPVSAAGQSDVKKTPLATVVKSPPQTSPVKSKPETPPKPQTDFRSNLRSRAPTETKQQDAPEFLAKFGNLRKAQTQNYVAPDVLKSNILRGKGDLSRTGGPVKSEIKEEFKDSLQAKKQQWKTEKDEGIVHERKISGPPQITQKPEALTQRELLGRSGSVKAPPGVDKPKPETPEALARQKSLREKPTVGASLLDLEKRTGASAGATTETTAISPRKQTSTPTGSTAVSSVKSTETSRLAARFNPALANVISRGPPAVIDSSSTVSGSDIPAAQEKSNTSRINAPSEPQIKEAALQDMRKGRAKGPKKRKGAEVTTSATPPFESESVHTPPQISDAESPAMAGVEPSTPVTKPKPRAPPGSAASLMMASMQKPSGPEQTEPAVTAYDGSEKSSDREIVAEKPLLPKKTSMMPATSPSEKPRTPLKGPRMSATRTTKDKTLIALKQSGPLSTPTVPTHGSNVEAQATDSNGVPEFQGFGSTKSTMLVAPLTDDNKENAGESSPSVKSSALGWGRQQPPKQAETPAQIQLPSRKDEEAAMRSAGLLGSSPSRPSSRSGLGIAADQSNGGTASSGLPPKPNKPSRAVSGQLHEASPNQIALDTHRPSSDVTRQIFLDIFGSVPESDRLLSIDTQAVISQTPYQERVFKTVRKTVHRVTQDGSLKDVPPAEEYTFFDESVYIYTHTYTVVDGPKKAEIFIWIGSSSSEDAIEQAQGSAKKLAKENGNAFVSSIRQGLEPSGFLQALGGILITRRGSGDSATKQYMLCGRKHLGQIVFDEVDFSADSLCLGFAYLISYPVTPQETRLYLWKGSCCSTEETSGARLAAMDLSETGEIIEVDDGAEFASFLKVFGPGTTKASIPQPSELWHQKAQYPSQFASRLFRIQQAEIKAGIFASMFKRRPSSNNVSPARKQPEDTKVEAKEVSPFTRSDLEADSIYLLDACHELYVLVGPVFPSQPQHLRDTLLAQTLLFASEYAGLAKSMEDRPANPKGFVLFSGVPPDLKLIFRQWDGDNGLWGTASLMAGSQARLGDEVTMVGLDDVLSVVCKS